MENNASLEARIATLRRTPIFGGISEQTVASLLKDANIAHRAAGECFFEQDDRGTSAFVLECGEVSILKKHDGRERLLRHLTTGDCFGEVALLDFGPRSASVRAISDCTAIELTAGQIRAIALQDPKEFALIYMNLGRELSRRLRAADERLFKARFTQDDVDGGWHFGSG